MGAVLRSLLACSFCVLLRGGRESGGTGKLVGFAGGKEGVSFCCVYGGEGRGGGEAGKGVGRGLVVGKEGARGPGEGAARSARPRCSPRLACPTASGQSVRPGCLAG